MNSKKSGVILGYIAMAITNLSSFFLTPLMLTVFGTSEFGVYKLVLSFMSYFALADLGLSNAIVRYVSEYRANNDKNSEGKFIGLVTLIDLLMGGVLFIAGIFFYYYIPQIFHASFSLKEIVLLKDLFFLVVIAGILTLFVNLAGGILKSYERFTILKTMNIVKTLVRVGLITVLLLLDFSPFEIVLVDTVLMLLVFIYSWYYCIKELKIKPIFRNIDSKYSRKILSYTLIVFVDAVAFHFFWAADTFIIGIYISSSAIAIYSIGTLLANLFSSFSVIISDVLMPDVVKQVTVGSDDRELTNYMIKIGRIKFLVLALPTLGFVFFGAKFINLWLGETFEEAYLIAILILIPQMIAALADVALYVMWAKNKHKLKSFVSLGICIINIILTIILVQKYGIIGAAISTCFAFVAGYLVFNSIYFHKVLKLDMIRFVKEIFNKLWLGLSIAGIGAYIISLYGNVSWFMLLSQVILTTLVYIVSVWFFGMNDSEKLMVAPLLKKIGIRNNK
ncbi:MAG: oligosaccharide flippase family protein [Lutibacter sp.]